MNWTAMLQTGNNRIVMGSVGLVVAGMLLAYALGIVWSVIAWSVFGATAIIVLAVLGQMLYVMMSVERGYRPNAPVGGRTIAEAQPRIPPQGLPAAAPTAMPKARSTQFEEAVADLRAAQYLLSKVQNSGAFREFSEPQKHECDHALEEVRALLSEVSRDTAVQRFAS